VVLEEVSVGVAYPAYPEPYSEVERRRVKQILKRSIDIESLNGILEKEAPTEAEISQLKDLVASLTEFINTKSPRPAAQEQKDGAQEREETSSENTETLELLETAIDLEVLDLEEIEAQVEEVSTEEEEIP
jgi:hypothetical protein